MQIKIEKSLKKEKNRKLCLHVERVTLEKKRSCFILKICIQKRKILQKLFTNPHFRNIIFVAKN